MEPWTVRRLIDWTRARFERVRLESPRLDAELLLSHATGLTRLQLYLDHDRALGETEIGAFRDLVRRRLDGEPVAYLVGRREFWSLDLRVDPRVLVPRPETETLVMEALARLQGRERPRVLDVGTGSGAIALAIARERADAEVWASDVSDGALAVARENAERLGLAVRFAKGDLVAGAGGGELFDLIVANLPYLRPDEVRPSLRFEPLVALTAGDDGLGLSRRLVAEAPAALCGGGALAFEVAAGRADEVAALFAAAGGWGDTSCRRDLGGIERVVSASRDG